MTAKFGEARRDAFFKALRETGNRTLAAEAAKVSQSWVTLHRARDPEFRRRMVEAMAEAKAKLAAHPERQPPSGWGFLDGEELVVKGSGGSGGRRVQIARARLRQITPRVEERFLAVLAATCNVKAACREAGISFGAMYAHRKRWPGFARRWDEAVEIGALQLEFALVAHAMNPFSPLGPARPAPVPPMRADQALHNLHMHQRRLRGTGGRPGRAGTPPPVEEVRAKIVRTAEAIRRARALSPAAKAAAERELERRREAMAPDEEEA